MPSHDDKTQTTIPAGVSTATPLETFRTRSIATRLTEAEFTQIEAAASHAGKKVAEWLRAAALKEMRDLHREHPKTDPILLAEVLALRDIVVNLFAVASKGPLTDQTLRKITAYADSIKGRKAAKLLEQNSTQGPDEAA